MKIPSLTLLMVFLLPTVSMRGQVSVADQAAMNALIKRKEANAKEQAQIAKEIALLEAKLDHKPPPLETRPTSGLEKFASEYKLKVTQSLTDKNKNTLPALFQYTHPADGRDSAQIDVALSLSHDINNPWKIPLSAGLTSEYHYNDASAKLQDSFALGGKLDAVLGPSTEYGQLLRTSVAYKRDNLVSGKGLIADLVWFISIPAWHVGDFQWKWGGFLVGRIEPFLALQEESGNGASKDFKNGDRFSSRAGISLKASLFPDSLANRLELDSSVSYWRHMLTSGGFDLYSTNQTYFVECLTYWLNTGSDPSGKLEDKEKHFGISVKYANGDNPSTSEFHADTWTFGLSILF